MNVVGSEFVSYEVAILLKEKGFDEPCLYHWERGIDNHGWGLFTSGYLLKQSQLMDSYLDEKDNIYGEFSAPTHDQVRVWFMRTISLSIAVKHYASGSYTFDIQKHNGDATGWTKLSSFMEKMYYNYSDAFDGGIVKAFEIVKI